MKSFKLLLASALVLALPLVAMQVHAQSKPSALSDAQKADVEAVVRELLLQKEPDLIVKAAQEMQRRMEEEQTAKANEGVAKNRDLIFKNAASPVAGNPKGDVTIVEFFDYQCGYCKAVIASVDSLLKEDKNIRFVFKELPILGPVSTLAAKAALASEKQGKYYAFHAALMESKERISETSIFETAKSIGLDVEKLKKDMESPAIDQAIKANIALSGEIGARGTPTFIVGDKLYPGALQLDQMKELVAKIRKDSGKK